MLALGLDPHRDAARERLESLLWTHALGLLRCGTSVVVEFGFWARREGERCRDETRTTGAHVTLIVREAPFEERSQRVEQRNHEPGAVVITREQLIEGERSWEPPTPEELATYHRPRPE